MPKIFSAFLLIIFSAINNMGNCQYYSDSSFQSSLNIYNNFSGINKHLYNGSAYVDYNHAIKGNPFFKETYFTKGSLDYDGYNYQNVTMFYDILNDNIIIKGFDTTNQLILVNEKIASFTCLDHSFIYINNDTLKNGIAVGFYDVLYNKTSEVLVKRKKVIDEKIGLQTTDISFKEADVIFIKKDDKYYVVDNRKNLLNALHDKQKFVSRFIHQKKIKFKADKENQIVEVVAYYDSLNETK